VQFKLNGGVAQLKLNQRMGQSNVLNLVDPPETRPPQARHELLIHGLHQRFFSFFLILSATFRLDTVALLSGSIP